MKITTDLNNHKLKLGLINKGNKINKLNEIKALTERKNLEKNKNK